MKKGKKRQKKQKAASNVRQVDENSTAYSAQPYRYQKLPKTSIRLLKILPSPENEIFCTLKTVSLDDEPVFDALSYSWGNPITIREKAIPRTADGRPDIDLIFPSHRPVGAVPYLTDLDRSALEYISSTDRLPFVDRTSDLGCSEQIICDGSKINVTDTLFDALLQLRRIVMSKKETNETGRLYFESLPVSRSEFIWIDAICINQNDIDERNEQVCLMNRIYASAQYVFAWLGESDWLAEMSFSDIIKFGRIQPDDSESKNNLKSYFGSGILRTQRLYALSALLSRQWFRRSWVVQEAVYARRLYLWSGSLFIDWWIIVPMIKAIEYNRLDVEMANLMSRLICRQTGKLGKRPIAIEPGMNNDLLAPSEIFTEILDNMKAAILFVNGVLDTKRWLGMPIYRSDQKSTMATKDENTAAKPDDSIPEPACQPQKDSTNTGASLKRMLESKFGNLSEPFASLKLASEDNDSARVNLSFINHSFTIVSSEVPVPVSQLSLMTHFRGRGASDPRDNVFAFLSLATETPDLKPNYRMSVQSVYIKTTQNILLAQDLTVLSHIQDPCETKVTGLPSWVPDYSAPLRKLPLVNRDGSSPYSACGKNLANSIFYVTVQDGTKMYTILSLVGFHVDTVAEVADEKGCYFTRVGQLALKTPSIYAKETTTAATLQKKVLVRIMTTPPEHKRPRAEEVRNGKCPRVEALWRTLVGDFCYKTYPAPVAAGFGFSDWVGEHLHWATHFNVIMYDRPRLSATEAENLKCMGDEPVLKHARESRAKKEKTFIDLIKDELGVFCTFEDVSVKFASYLEDPEYNKQYTKLGYTLEMNVACFLPDARRLDAYQKCTVLKSPPEALDVDYSGCPDLTPDERARKNSFEARMREMQQGRRMFRTTKNYLGMGPKSTQVGDQVWVLPGAKVPFVLRPFNDGKAPLRFTLIGDAYLHGFMDGEVSRGKAVLAAFGLV